MKKEESNDDLFKNEFDDFDLEKEFNNNNYHDKKENPFGGSTTKELLQQSKKEIEKEGLKDVLNDLDGKGQKKLQIEIDENANIAE